MDKVAEMVGSAVVQEVISRAVSFLLGKREEKASQGHLMERLKMAAIKMELALERSKKLPILDVSLLTGRKMIKCVYIEAMDLLDKNKQQAVPAGREQIAQGVKRKWSCIITDANKNNLPVSSLGGLNIESIKQFEQVGLFASEFVRDLETGCSLSHYNFCNPIVRLLLDEGKPFLSCEQKQGNKVHYWVDIFRACVDEERGVEAVLVYRSTDFTNMEEKSFRMDLILRLSERTDIAGVSIKACQLLTSQLKLVTESSIMEQLILLPTLLHDVNAYSYMPCWALDHSKSCIKYAQLGRQDPSCCGARRNGIRSNNGVSSELSHMFPEEVIQFYFSTTASSRSSSSNEAAAGSRSIHSRGWTPPLVLSAVFAPHRSNTWVSQGTEITVLAGNVEEERGNASIQQVSEALESDAVSCFLRQPELTKYMGMWRSNHGTALFWVGKPRIIQRRRRSRYNTRASTKRRSARS